MTGPQVRCVGDVMTDVVVHLPGPPTAGPPAAGRPPADRPPAGSSVANLAAGLAAGLVAGLAAGSDTPAAVRLTGGGAAANTACWLARLGVRTALTARIGDDPAGRAAAEDLAGSGVVADLEVDPERPTGVCLVLVDAAGERTMLPDAGANAALAAVPAPPADHLHVSGYALFHERVRPVVLAAAAAARAAGASVSVDLASSAPLRRIGPGEVRRWCAGATVYANLDEARVLTGRGDPAAAALALARWGHTAVVKAGPAGAWWARAEEVGHVPVPEVVTDPVDTTGAGDAFAAGHLAASLHGAPPAAAVAAGHAAAARVLGRVGARPPRPA